MRSRTTRTRKDKYSSGHDCFFVSPNLRASCLGLTTYRSNLVSPEQNWRHHSVSVKLGVVPHKLIYGLNMAMFESRQELLELTTGNDARGALTGVPRNGTGHRIPCDKFSHQRSLRALLRDVSAR